VKRSRQEGSGLEKQERAGVSRLKICEEVQKM
jgi:hypothetical protein